MSGTRNAMKKPAEDLAEIDSAPGDDPTLAAGPTATAGATAAAGTPTATEKAKANKKIRYP